MAAKLGLGAAARYALELGLGEIEERVRTLAERLRGRLAAIEGVQVRDRGARRCGIVSFTVDGLDAGRVADELGRCGVRCGTSSVTSTRLDFEARGLDSVVRAGVHYFNTAEEIDRCAKLAADAISAALR